MRIRIVTKEHASLISAIDEIGQGRTHITIEELGAIDFISILYCQDDYHLLVETLGFNEALTTLFRLNDAVAAPYSDKHSDLQELTQSNEFHEGALRDDETWNAFRQAARHLSPLPIPDHNDSAESFSLEASLRGFAGKHHIDADFGPTFPLSRRVMVIAGENGAGKTRLFRAIVDSLQNQVELEMNDPLEPSVLFNKRPTFSRITVMTSAPSEAYPPNIPPWSGLDYKFHRMAGQPGGEYDDLAELLVDCLRSADSGGAIRSSESMKLLGEVVDLLGIRNQLHVEVREAETPDLLPAPAIIGGRHYLPLLTTQGEQRKLQLQARMLRGRPPVVILGLGTVRQLSSGEQALLRFTAQAVGSARTATLFLIDEPESHLHPRFVSQFMTILDRVLNLTHSIALLATHSAYIVREVPARRVKVMRRNKDGSVSVGQPGLQTYGATIDTISQFVFDDLSPTHRFQSALKQWLLENPDADVKKFRDSFSEDLNSETLSYFASLIDENRDR